LQALRMNKNK